MSQHNPVTLRPAQSHQVAFLPIHLHSDQQELTIMTRIFRLHNIVQGTHYSVRADMVIGVAGESASDAFSSSAMDGTWKGWYSRLMYE